MSGDRKPSWDRAVATVPEEDRRQQELAVVPALLRANELTVDELRSVVEKLSAALSSVLSPKFPDRELKVEPFDDEGHSQLAGALAATGRAVKFETDRLRELIERLEV